MTILTLGARIIACALILCSCTSAFKQDRVLKIGLSAEVATLDPAIASDTVSTMVISQSIETLYEYDYLRRPYSLKPLLAAALPMVSADGRHYTIRLRRGIYYHSDPSLGVHARELQAQDFINQFKRLAFIPTNSSGWWLLEGKVVGLDQFRQQVGDDIKKFFTTDVEGLKANDPYVLEITLTEPSPQMIYVLAMLYTAPIPASSIRYYKNDLSKNMIGTGPYIKTTDVHGPSIIMNRNQDYRQEFYPEVGDREANLNNLLVDAGKPIPFINTLEFKTVKESSERWKAFLNKEIDYLSVPVDYFSQVVQADGNLHPHYKNQEFNLYSSSTLTSWWLAFNMKDPLVGKNKHLRLAIAHALDIDSYISSFTNNLGQRANSLYAPGIAGHEPTDKLPYHYNLQLAKAYLAKAGYPDGKGLPTLRYDLRDQSAQNINQARLLKQALSAIGIKMEIVSNTFPEFLKKAREGKLQFWLGGWTYDYPDAENLLQLLISRNMSPGPNATNFSNRDFDHYFEQIKIMPNGSARTEILNQMENIVHQEVPWIMLYSSRNFILTQSYLKNFRDSDLIFNHLKYLRLD